MRVEVLAGAQVLEEGAAQVLLDLLLGLLDGDLGQACDRRQVEELRRVGGGGAGPLSSSTAPTASSPEAIGTSAATSAGTSAGRSLHAVADVAPQRATTSSAPPRRPAGATAAAPRRGRTMATGAAHRVGGQGGHPGEPVAAQDGVEHRQVHLAQPRHERRPPARGGAPPAAASREAARRDGAHVVRSRRPEHPSLRSSASAVARRVRVRLEHLLAGLARADAVALVDRQHEHLAVADGAGPRVLEDRLHDRLHVTVGDDALQLDLGPQVVRQLRAAVALRDALLSPGALHLADGQRGEPELEQLHADGLERLVADVGLDLLHAVTSFWVGIDGRPPGPAGPWSASHRSPRAPGPG